MKALWAIGIAAITLITCVVFAPKAFDGESANVEAVKIYAVSVISPLLEDFRKKHGRYPNKLDELPMFQLNVAAKKMSFTYGASWSDGHYEFSFSPDDLAGITGRWDYHSGRRRWSLDR